MSDSYYTPPTPWSAERDYYGPPQEPLVPPSWQPEELGTPAEDIMSIFEDIEISGEEPQETIDLHKFDDLTDEELFDVFFEPDLDLRVNNDDEDDGA